MNTATPSYYFTTRKLKYFFVRTLYLLIYAFKMPHLLNKSVLFLIAFAIIVPFTGCSGKDPKENKQEQVKESYLCPMKCTSETFSKPGQCPVCNMELEKAEPS